MCYRLKICIGTPVSMLYIFGMCVRVRWANGGDAAGCNCACRVNKRGQHTQMEMVGKLDDGGPHVEHKSMHMKIGFRASVTDGMSASLRTLTHHIYTYKKSNEHTSVMQCRSRAQTRSNENAMLFFYRLLNLMVETMSIIERPKTPMGSSLFIATIRSETWDWRLGAALTCTIAELLKCNQAPPLYASVRAKSAQNQEKLYYPYSHTISYGICVYSHIGYICVHYICYIITWNAMR